MSKRIGGVILFILGLAGMAWVYSMRPLSMAETVRTLGQAGAFGRTYIGSPAYEVFLVLTGLISVVGALLIFVGGSKRNKSTE